jgi:hypothetical protein
MEPLSWVGLRRRTRSPFNSDRATIWHDTAAYADAPNLKISKHLVVHLCAVDAAVLGRLGDGLGTRRDKRSPIEAK